MRLRQLAAAMLASSAMCSAQAQPPAVQIILDKEAQVTGPRYSLGDIATVHAVDGMLGRRLTELPVGIAPRVGYAETVDRGRLQARIEHVLPGFAERIDWQGAQEVVVRIDDRGLAAESYRQVAEHFLGQWLAQRYERFEFEPRGRFDGLRLPRGEISLAARLAGSETLSSRMCVWVDIRISGELYRSLPVWFAVTVYRDVLVAAQELRPGTVLEPSTLMVQKMDVTAMRGEVLSPKDEFAGRRLRKPLRVGEPVREAMLEPLLPVVRGEEVAVTSRVGKVAVIVLATALEDGNVGERVRVRRGEQGEMLAVRVTGKSSAVVEGRRYE